MDGTERLDQMPNPSDRAMTPEIYALWCEAWQTGHLGQNPPTNEQVNSIMEMFGFTVAELFGIIEETT